MFLFCVTNKKNRCQELNLLTVIFCLMGYCVTRRNWLAVQWNNRMSFKLFRTFQKECLTWRVTLITVLLSFFIFIVVTQVKHIEYTALSATEQPKNDCGMWKFYNKKTPLQFVWPTWICPRNTVNIIIIKCVSK